MRMQVPFFPPVQTLADFDAHACKKLLVDAIGKTMPDLKVESVRSWVMSAQVASKFRVRIPNTFLNIVQAGSGPAMAD